MGWSGRATVKCKYFDCNSYKCVHPKRKNWYSILMPDCIEDVDKRAKCALKSITD